MPTDLVEFLRMSRGSAPMHVPRPQAIRGLNEGGETSAARLDGSAV